MVIIDYLLELGLCVGLEKFKDRVNEHKLKSALKNYIEQQKRYNELCSLAEEIDFQGLMEYIYQNLMDAVETRMFNPNKKERGRARDDIMRAAIAYSKVDTDQARHRVYKCIDSCLDIIRVFYISGISKKEFLIASEIVDAVAEEVQASTGITVDAIDTAVSDLSNQIKSAADSVLTQISENSSLFSLDRAVELAENGKITEIESGFKKMVDVISTSHPYYPDFGYDFAYGKIRSKPLNENAKKLYPAQYVLTGTVRFDDQHYDDSIDEPLAYAYRHQIPMMMEISKAVKYLGNRPDPQQDEAIALNGNVALVTPPEFPPAFPCAIKVGNQTFFEYVLLRTQEILDDGTYVIGNKEQGGAFYFEVKINTDKPNKPNFIISVNDASNRELLNYVKCMKALSEIKNIHIYVLSAGEDIIASDIKDINYKTGFSSVDEEIDFLERICVIEEYFEVKLDPSDDISNKDYKTVLYISDLIRNDEVAGTWDEATFTGVLDQHFREKLATMSKKTCMFSYVGVSQIQLFGTELEFKFMRCFKCSYMADLEKVKRKAEVLDDGDSIKITLKAGEDKSMIDTLKIPEKMERSS